MKNYQKNLTDSHERPIVAFEVTNQPNYPSDIIQARFTEPKSFENSFQIKIIGLLCGVDPDFLIIPDQTPRKVYIRIQCYCSLIEFPGFMHAGNA